MRYFSALPCSHTWSKLQKQIARARYIYLCWLNDESFHYQQSPKWINALKVAPALAAMSDVIEAALNRFEQIKLAAARVDLLAVASCRRMMTKLYSLR